ncbi:MAG TPA: DUF2268 domain-containing putative Zn-dependent protease [Blastocatellia bacterium]|nr:DUF2268 domain-containing putative Zn-dependent protease [Blastocatellia bacterium]
MPNLKKVAVLIALLLLSSHAPKTFAGPALDRTIFERLFEGPKIVNIVDDFLVYWEQAKHLPLVRQRKLWMQMVENKHRDYFDRAVYRNTDLKSRRAMLNEFLVRVPEKIDAIREFNRNISDAHTSLLIMAFIDFKTRFREYQQQRDIYIGLSLFRFDGSVRPVHNDSGIPDTLCLGAEVLADYPPDHLRVALLHEFFHLYHFSFLFQQPALAEFRTPHMPLMIEGMAVAGTEAIYPGHKRSFYLHFSDEELTAQQEELSASAAHFLELIAFSAPPERYAPWFANSQSDDAPPRGGYLLGYEVINRVLATSSLEQMLHMTPAELREHAEEQLSAMASGGILILASSH